MKETKAIKLLLQEHQACALSVASQASHCDAISLTEALNPSLIALRLKQFHGTGTMLSADKQEAIQSYLLMCRSNEELNLLKDDAKNIVQYYEAKMKIMCEKLNSLSDKLNPYSRGCTALLQSALPKIDSLLKQGRSAMHSLNEQDSSQLFQESDESCYSSSIDSSDNDSDDF